MLSPEQIELRRKGITGTDIGAIIGLSEHRSSLDVWADKTGRAEPVDLTPALKRGIYLEDGVLRWYGADTGAAHVERPGTIQLASQPLIMATPDGIARFEREDLFERRGVEVKCPGPFMEQGWGEPGTDQVPQAYLAQAVFEMAVLDVERLDFAALLGGELRIYPVTRNRDVEGLLIERALKFWRDHVVADKAPDPTWRARDVEWVKKTFPVAHKPALAWESLTPEQRLTVEMYLDAHRREGELSREVAELELRVKMFVGDAAGITNMPVLQGSPYSRIDWKENEKGTPAWKKIAEALKGGMSWDEALATFTGAPSRPFVARKSKKGEE